MRQRLVSDAGRRGDAQTGTAAQTRTLEPPAARRREQQQRGQRVGRGVVGHHRRRRHSTGAGADADAVGRRDAASTRVASAAAHSAGQAAQLRRQWRAVAEQCQRLYRILRTTTTPTRRSEYLVVQGSTKPGPTPIRRPLRWTAGCESLENLFC